MFINLYPDASLQVFPVRNSWGISEVILLKLSGEEMLGLVNKPMSAGVLSEA